MRTDGVFAVVSVAAVVLALGTAPLVQSSAATGADRIRFDPAGPEEYTFAAPPSDGYATVDGERYDTLDAALEAVAPGDTVRIHGTVDGPVNVTTPGVRIVGGDGFGVVDGRGNGTVLTVSAPNVTLDHLWVRDSGYAASSNDAGVWIAGRNVSIRDSRVTNVTFGIWVDGVAHARIQNVTIVGRESVTPLSNRGNGIQLWRADHAVVRNVRITDVRDGIYFSWAQRVVARNNTMWDLRYGVHYMYSESCRLVNNTAFDNDVGFALMLSENLTIRGNRAVNNTGTSGHGILLKRIDHSTIRGNHVVGNENGLFVYNAQHNTLTSNLIVDNRVGVHLTAGSVDERVVGNTFVGNGIPVYAVIGQQVAWNNSTRGNYWADARTADVDDDGVSELRYRPAGLVQQLTHDTPAARMFTTSPAFRAIRLAQSSLPVVEAPGVVDHRPLVTPPTTAWRNYYATHRT